MCVCVCVWEGEQVLFLDTKQAHVRVPAVRDVRVELPPERASPGYGCRHKRCVHGTRGAPRQWERCVAAALEAFGVWRGRASAVCFFHPSRGSMA